MRLKTNLCIACAFFLSSLSIQLSFMKSLGDKILMHIFQSYFNVYVQIGGKCFVKNLEHAKEMKTANSVVQLMILFQLFKTNDVIS